MSLVIEKTSEFPGYHKWGELCKSLSEMEVDGIIRVQISGNIKTLRTAISNFSRTNNSYKFKTAIEGEWLYIKRIR